MPTDKHRVIAVHSVILYQPVCHSCGWNGDLWAMVSDADHEAERHTECQVTE